MRRTLFRAKVRAFQDIMVDAPAARVHTPGAARLRDIPAQYGPFFDKALESTILLGGNPGYAMSSDIIVIGPA